MPFILRTFSINLGFSGGGRRLRLKVCFPCWSFGKRPLRALNAALCSDGDPSPPTSLLRWSSGIHFFSRGEHVCLVSQAGVSLHSALSCSSVSLTSREPKNYSALHMCVWGGGTFPKQRRGGSCYPQTFDPGYLTSLPPAQRFIPVMLLFSLIGLHFYMSRNASRFPSPPPPPP